MNTYAQTSTNHLAIAKLALEIEIKSLNLLADVLDHNFEKAVELIINTLGKVVVSGIGKSAIAAHKIAATFSSVGVASVFMHGADSIHGDLGIISSTDIVIIISNSGFSSEFVNITEYCMNIKVPVISIIGNRNSLLYDQSDVVLLLPEFTEVALKIPSTSFTLTSVIGDALAACIVTAKKVTLDEYKKYHPGGKIGNSLIRVSEVMRTGADIPIAKSGTLMSEAIILMTASSLGCIIVSDNDRHILGMVTDGDLRRHMSNNLTQMKVDDIMTESPKTIASDVFIADAIEYMNAKKVTNLIVSRNKKILGVIHIHDCLKYGLQKQIK